MRSDDAPTPASGCIMAIGRAIAEGVEREGATVIVTGHTTAAVDAAVQAIAKASGTQVHGYAGDLGAAESAAQLVERYPNVEIPINNLGISEPKPFDAIADDCDGYTVLPKA